MRRLEETKSTHDRPYSGMPRVTEPNQDREIRLAHIHNRFVSLLQTTETIHGRYNPKIYARTVLQRSRENNIRLRRAFAGPVQNY